MYKKIVRRMPIHKFYRRKVPPAFNIETLKGTVCLPSKRFYFFFLSHVTLCGWITPIYTCMKRYYKETKKKALDFILNPPNGYAWSSLGDQKLHP